MPSVIKTLFRLDLEVQDIVDQHITGFPVGGVFTPERSAINPFGLFMTGKKLGLTNIYFTLSPDERDGRVLWRYFDNVLQRLPRELREQGFRLKIGETADLGKLRSAGWSLGSPKGFSYKILGLTDDPNYMLPVGDVAVVQVRDVLKDKLANFLSGFEGKDEIFEVVPVISPQDFDNILFESKTLPLFATLSPLREKYRTIGDEGVVGNIARQIDFEIRTQEIEKALEGRNLSELSEGEKKRIFEGLFGSGGKERK